MRAVLTLAMLLAFHASAETIDRVAVSIGKSVITASAIDREIRLAAFEQHQPPDLSPANRRATAERMIDRKLIERELENYRYPALDPDVADGELAEYRRQFFPNEDAFRTRLLEYGINENDFKKQLLWRDTFLNFVDMRFKPGVQVTDQEIQDYFTKTVEPLARAAHPEEDVTLDAYHDRIEATLTGQRADEQREIWLKEARKRTEIIFHDEAFQ